MIDYAEALKTLFIVILRRQSFPEESQFQAHLKGMEKTPSGIVKKVAEFYLSKERKIKNLESGVSGSLLKFISSAPRSFINSVMGSGHLKQDQQQWLALLEAETSYLLANFNDFIIKYNNLPSSKKCFLDRPYAATCFIVSWFSSGQIVTAHDDLKAEQVYSLEALEESRATNAYFMIEDTTTLSLVRNIWFKGKVKVTISVISNVEVGRAYEVSVCYKNNSFKGICSIQKIRCWYHVTEHMELPTNLQVKVTPLGIFNFKGEVDFKINVSAPVEDIKKVEKDSFMLTRESIAPALVFVHLEPDLKQRDSLLPVYSALKEKGYNCHFKAIIAQNCDIDIYDPIFIISAPEVYKHLKKKYPNQKYVFLEHGASPVKEYTYRPHYCAYDLLLLPGSLWKERLLSLYPDAIDDSNVQIVGYPKVQDSIGISQLERTEWCGKYTLDANLPVVLFAPTWSGGDENAGIFNFRYLRNVVNTVVFPHDADRKYVKKALGSDDVPIIELSQQENKSISDVYPYIDILVSDISSTAIEFAALGGKAVCIIPKSIKDFDNDCIEGNAIKINHTDRFWDFCPVVRPEKLNQMLEMVINGDADHLYDFNKVRGVLDFIGDESVVKSVEAISSFIESSE